MTALSVHAFSNKVFESVNAYCRLSFEQNKVFTLCLRATEVTPIYSREAGSECLCFFVRDTQIGVSVTSFLEYSRMCPKRLKRGRGGEGREGRK